jgi:hypothetical protein
VATEQHLLIRGTIEVVKLALTGHDSVELLNHEAQRAELIGIALRINEYMFLNEEVAHLDITHVLSHAHQGRSEARTQILEALLLIEK